MHILLGIFCTRFLPPVLLEQLIHHDKFLEDMELEILIQLGNKILKGTPNILLNLSKF
jgi:hypothetical protein